VRLRIKKKERVLLLNSQVVQPVAWLRRLLEQHDRITEEQVAALPEKQRRYLDNMLNRLVTQAASEWKGDPKKTQDLGPDESRWQKCQLCGQKIRYVFEIHNPLTGRFLQVGKECVKHFDIQFGGRSIAELIREAERMRRLGGLEERLPGAARVVEGWRADLDRYPMVVPQWYEEKHRDLGKRAEGLYRQYLEGHIDEESVVAQLSEVLRERDALLKEIDGYVRVHAGDKFAAGKEIALWLRNFGGEKRDLVLMMIREAGGKITWQTAHRIAEPNFMKLVAAELAGPLVRVGVRRIEVDPGRGGYVLELARPVRLRLFCRHGDLVLRYGGLMFGEPLIYPLDLDALAEICALDRSEAAIRDVLIELSRLMRSFGIRSWGYAYEYNEAVFYDSETAEYLVLELKRLLEEALGVLLRLRGASVEQFVTWVRKTAKRMTREKLREVQQIRRQGYVTVAV